MRKMGELRPAKKPQENKLKTSAAGNKPIERDQVLHYSIVHQIWKVLLSPEFFIKILYERLVIRNTGIK